MKKILIVFAAVTFGFSACSENKKENSATGEQAGETTGTASTEAPVKIVVETPDYTADAAAVKPLAGQILEEYLKLKAAITKADAPAVTTRAQAIVEVANKLDVAALPAEQQEFTRQRIGEIKQSAERIANAANIKGQRAHLEPLSEATFALTKAYGASDQKLYYQYCPMAHDNQGAYWLSATPEILNPYFGQGMLTCGSTEEVYN